MPAVDLVGIGKRSQIGNEEKIEKELQIRCLFIVLEFGAIINLLVLGGDRIVTVARLGVSLNRQRDELVSYSRTRNGLEPAYQRAFPYRQSR